MADNLKALVSQGLAAMKAGSDVAAHATDEIAQDATHPDLKAALGEGNRTSKEWAARIDRALQQAGGDQQDNPILEAHYEVSRRIRQQATDEQSRDLGIIASGQLALHYWIAAFGTMANYTRTLGLADVAQDMKSSADEAKQADEKHTRLAEQLLG
jgi:ferritin-like metal-binding protein YciE